MFLFRVPERAQFEAPLISIQQKGPGLTFLTYLPDLEGPRQGGL